MKRCILITTLLLMQLISWSQADTAQVKRVVKKGWSFGALPAISYNSDLGFQYGALANIYHFGDGSRYPDYNHSLYVEWSRTTKGNGINQIVYDSEKLIPNTRVTSELSYLTEQTLDFYGFNGYGAHFNANYTDTDHEDYLSRMFYRIDRRRFFFRADFQPNLMGTKIRGLIGYSVNSVQVREVDIDKINDGVNEADKVPSFDEQPSLYHYYKEAGIISPDEADGGTNHLLKIGGVYDSRNVEANPGKGILLEAFLLANPGFSTPSYGKFIVNWHQYFTLVPNRIHFAYRVSYQPKIWGDIPWYMRSFMYDTRRERNGLGGSKSLRGILRNRIVGDGFAFSNIELRTILFRTVIFNQNFYLGIVPFVDMGLVTNPVELDYDALANIKAYPNNNNTSLTAKELVQPSIEEEGLHTSYGGELKLVLNDNFIVSVSYGRSTDLRDGEGGRTYIGLNYLF